MRLSSIAGVLLGRLVSIRRPVAWAHGLGNSRLFGLVYRLPAFGSVSIKGSRWNIGTTLPWVSSDAWIDILNLRLVELKSAHKAHMLLTNIGDCTMYTQ